MKIGILAVYGAMGGNQKNIYASVAIPPTPVRVSNQWPLVTSVTSVFYIMIRKIMRLNRGLPTDVLAITL